jgi:hypothetical protein
VIVLAVVAVEGRVVAGCELVAFTGWEDVVGGIVGLELSTAGDAVFDDVVEFVLGHPVKDSTRITKTIIDIANFLLFIPILALYQRIVTEGLLNSHRIYSQRM